MIDRLLSILSDLYQELIPFIVVKQYDKGVRLRFGKFKEVLNAGLHWKIPFVDEMVINTVAWTTINLPPQSLVTKDNKSIVISAVIKYRITDIQVFTLEVWDAVDAISDMTLGIIKKNIMSKSWEEVRHEGFDNELSKKARVEAKRWGIEIDSVTLANLDQIKSIRLFNDSTLLS